PRCRSPHLPDSAERLQGGRLLRRPQQDYPAATVVEYCSAVLKVPDFSNEQATFAQRLKDLIAREEYQATGIYDDVRFERHVRSHLRKVAKMAKANEGFGKTLHYQ
ncbi:hypothetical protein OSJ57_10090, partial [Sphingomonas sp. HH69]